MDKLLIKLNYGIEILNCNDIEYIEYKYIFMFIFIINFYLIVPEYSLIDYLFIYQKL